MNRLAPSELQERIHSLDAMRGFALLGILLVNITAFSFPVLYMNPLARWNEPWDVAAVRFVDLFAESSFYSLFSFLFGYSLVLFIERIEARGYKSGAFLLRRLSGLLMAGLLHAFLIWSGDILISYALAGLLLVCLLRLETIWLLLIPSSILIVNAGIGGLLSVQDAAYSKTYIDRTAHSLDAYTNGPYSALFQQRLQDWLFINNPENAFFIALAILPMFLFGAYTRKRKWFSNEGNLKEMRLVWAGTFLAGFALKSYPLIFERTAGSEYLQNMVGGPLTAVFYALTLFFLIKRGIGLKIFSCLSAAGRVSLSNYLLQSIVGTFIFYYYGFGLYGSVRPAYGIILAIVIFFGQAWASKVWLKFFRQGPAEWVWKAFTYKGKQKFIN